MLSRVKGLFATYKRGVKNEGNENEREDFAAADVALVHEPVNPEIEEKRRKVEEFLEPIDKNWDFIEKTLLWRNALPACICFFFISGVFWKFISLRLRKIALIFGGFLLANGLSSDMRVASWDFFTRNFNLQTQGSPVLQFNFGDFCLFLATNWAMLENAIKSYQQLSRECPPKFYCILAVSLFSLLTLFTYFPVAELLYLAICGLFFYPAMHYYGIIDRAHARLLRLSAPVVKHWENNRTKRTRPAIKQSVHEQQYQLYDSDDEFILDKNQFTAKVLSSVVPDDDIPCDFDFQRDADSEKANDEHSNSNLDADLFTESQFEENLTMPSMSNYDSLMEPYDEFHSGLQFPDYTDSSKADALNILDAAANNVDTDDDMDDLPYEPEVARSPNQASNGRSRAHQRIPEADNYNNLAEVPRYSNEVSRENANDCYRTEEEYTQEVEADFEFLDHSDLEEEIDLPANYQSADDQARHTMASYTGNGIATVSKWLGYQ